MNLYQRIVGAIVTVLWAGMYVAATIDRSLEPLAQSLTPVALVFVGFLFGTAGIKLIRGERDEDSKS